MRLDPDSLTVESFDVSQPDQPIGGDSVKCSIINTCATCWTDCPCA
jgi:hypothetical protein